MIVIQDCYERALRHERVFRAVVQDIAENRLARPMGQYVPEDLDSTVPLETLLRRDRNDNGFVIADFKMMEPQRVLISFMNCGALSGGGAELVYQITKEDTVNYLGAELIIRS